MGVGVILLLPLIVQCRHWVWWVCPAPPTSSCRASERKSSWWYPSRREATPTTRRAGTEQPSGTSLEPFAYRESPDTLNAHCSLSTCIYKPSCVAIVLHTYTIGVSVCVCVCVCVCVIEPLPHPRPYSAVLYYHRALCYIRSADTW